MLRPHATIDADVLSRSMSTVLFADVVDSVRLVEADEERTIRRWLAFVDQIETELARKNLQFYIKHALHNAADFLFIFNGDTDADKLLPEAGNIRSIHRENKCYDLGAFAEVLTTNDLYKKYKKYITMNASIRGPFLPYWSQGCWSDMYLSKITEDTKVHFQVLM